MKSRFILFYFWFMAGWFLTSCTGGEVQVNSLGLALESVSLKQSNSQNDFLELNKDSRILRFKITCTEEYSEVEFRPKGKDEWLKGTSIQCSTPDTFFSIDLKSLNVELIENSLNIFEFRFVSEKGYSDPIEKSIVLSQYVASSASAVIVDFSGFTNTLTVNVAGNAQYSYKSGQSHQPSEIYITDTAGCLSGGTWQTYQSEIPWTLKKSNDSNQVYIKFRDGGLTESDCTMASTYHDNTAPAASQLTFLGFPAASLTNLSAISMNLLAIGDPFEMKISNSPICVGGDWETYATQKDNWTVGSLNSMNQVSVKFRDQAHNESSCLAANFTHDSLPPAIPTMSLILGTNPGQMTTPGFQISGLSIGDQFELYGEGACATPLTIQNLASTSTFYFPSLSTDGNYQYFVRIRDAATNWLECQGPLYLYKLDRVAPTATSTGHPLAASNVASWTETVSGTDLYEYKYKIGTSVSTTCSNKGTGYSGWITFSSQPTIDMDISALVDGNITLCIYGRDQAQNEQVSPTQYTWTKNTSSLQSTLLASTLPSAVSNITALNVTVGGYLIDQYKFKVGIAGSTDCTLAAGYSGSWTGIGTNITASVSGFPNASIVRLCVIGRNSGSTTEQPLSLETKHDFTRDTQPATVTSIDFPPAGDYLTSDDVIFGINFNEEVVLDPTAGGTRTAEIKLNGGATTRYPAFYRRVSPTKLEFLYKVVTGDTGNFGHSNQLNLPTAGFIKDKAGNSLTVASGAITANLSNSTVQLHNQNPAVSISWDSSDFFLESSNQVTFRVSIPSAISTSLDFAYQLETYTLDGVTKNLISGSDTIAAGQTSKIVTVSGINNALTENHRGIAVDLRKINHGYFGTKTIFGIIQDDETPYDGDVVDFAMGMNDACFYTTNGSVYCFGVGTYGELGSGVAGEIRPIPIKIPSLSGVTQLVTHEGSTSHYCAKASDGIYCWGYGGEFALGLASPINQTTPFKVTGIGTNPTLTTLSDFGLTCSYDSIVGTKCWGENNSGFAGTNSTLTNITSPTSVVASINNYKKSIEGSGSSTTYLGRCVLMDDGNATDGYPAYCWGEGTSGVSGVGNSLTRVPTLLMAPQVMDIVPVSRGFCAYGDFNAGKPGYEVSCWGASNTITFVLGFTNTTEYTPREILGFENTQKVHFTSAYGCAVGDYDNGVVGLEIKCWGQNSNGRLANGTTSTSQTAPTVLAGVSITSVDDLKLSLSSACAKKTDGTLWCWGSGFGITPSQQLSAGTFNDFFPGSNIAIIKTTTNGLQCIGTNCSNTIRSANLPTSGVTSLKISENGTQFCFIYSGHLSCIGAWNSSRFGFGEIALTSTTMTYSSSELSKILDDGYFCFETPFSSNYQCRSSNQFVLGKPVSALFTSLIDSKIPVTAKKVTFGYNSYAFIDSLDNLIQAANLSFVSLASFGVSNHFQAVNNIKSLTSYQAISADGFHSFNSAILPVKQAFSFVHANATNNGSYHYCFPTSTGTVRCAAANSSGYTSGQLGDNNTVSGALNVFRTPLISVGSELIDVVETATGGGRSCARTSIGELYCWGANIDSGGTTPAPMARLMMVGVTKVKMDLSGRIFAMKTDNKLYVAASSGVSFTERFANVTDFWGTLEGICVKRADGHYYCLPDNNTDLSTFGRFFDQLPFTVY